MIKKSKGLRIDLSETKRLTSRLSRNEYRTLLDDIYTPVESFEILSCLYDFELAQMTFDNLGQVVRSLDPLNFELGYINYLEVRWVLNETK